jgi:hypothetical protein
VTAEIIDSFTRAYIECALWSSTDDDGEPLDANYSVDDIAQETLDVMIYDCARFQAENAQMILMGRDRPTRDYTDTERAGHDFWLNRNGHGCGFWDGDWPEPQATNLDRASKAFGEYSLYVGDDGQICGS